MSPAFPCSQTPLYRAASVRQLDALAIAAEGTGSDASAGGYTLMKRAGQAAFEALRARWPEARSLSVCCGSGNNGGDGYVIARLALADGLEVQLITVSPVEELSGSAALAARDWLASGGQTEPADAPLRGQLLVDALFGTGLSRPATGRWAELIERMNASGRPVVAVDLPSGLSADTGMPLGTCIRADLTVSFIGRKRGLYTGQAGNYCGELQFHSLGLPEELRTQVEADAWLLDEDAPRRLLPPRAASTHKGRLGQVFVAGGNRGMPGAAILAGQAALRSGAGLVSLLVHPQHVLLGPAVQPELMSRDASLLAPDAKPLKALHSSNAVLAIGPGLGQDGWAEKLWQHALMLNAELPLVVDADALNLLASAPVQRGHWVLTPHPGEAARLLGASVDAVQADRFAAARALAERYQAVVVLKGHGSLIAVPGQPIALCPFGGPAMASAGMGDALTGIIASLIAQGLDLATAACLGTLLHALAGDQAARGRRQILASDLINTLHKVLPA